MADTDQTNPALPAANNATAGDAVAAPKRNPVSAAVGADSFEESPAKRVKLDDRPESNGQEENKNQSRQKGTAPIKKEYVVHPLPYVEISSLALSGCHRLLIVDQGT